MQIEIFPSDTRGIAEHSWLHTRFSYSFADYFNPQRMGFGLLRVLNDDIIDPSGGFGMHPHNNMEIITIPLSGSLEHKDSMGNGSIIETGDVQVMSAGSGVFHSEFNPSDKEKVNLFQIWILPNQRNVEPRYDQRTFDVCERFNKFQLLVGPFETENALHIHQDAYLSLGNFKTGSEASYVTYKPDNGLFIMVVKGNTEVSGYNLNYRDSAEIKYPGCLKFKFATDSEVLLIEVPLI